MAEKNLGDMMYKTFGTPEGKVILWWILDQCGMFSGIPEQINPAMVSFGNRLLSEMGAFSPRSAGDLMTALIEISSPKNRKNESEKEDSLFDEE